MTSDERLLNYIKTQLGSGHSSEDIRQALIEKGWQLDVIDQAMSDVGEVEPVNPDKRAAGIQGTNKKPQEKKSSSF